MPKYAIITAPDIPKVFYRIAEIAAREHARLFVEREQALNDEAIKRAMRKNTRTR